MTRYWQFSRSLRCRVQLWHGVLLALVLGTLAVREWDTRVMLLKRDLGNDIYRAAFCIDAAIHGRSIPFQPGPPPTGESALLPSQKALGMYYAIWRNGEAKPSEVSANAPPDLFKPTLDHEGLLETRSNLRAWFINSVPGDYVVAGRSLDRDYVACRWMGLRIALAAAAIWTAVMAAGWWLIGRELRPVRTIATVAQQIAGGDLTRRIGMREKSSELGALSAVLDETFSQLESSFNRQARFTADAAHELRTPVAVILTQTQNTLAGQGLMPEHRKALEASERAAQRMRWMIEALLQLARLDEGREIRTEKSIDLGRVATEAMELLRPLATEKGGTIITDLQSIQVHGDAAMLSQVVANLIGNAIHHGREGGVIRVTVGLEGSQAPLEVSDDGPGIAPGHELQIFDRFYRVDQARTGSVERTGLGLAISEAIIEAHGGTIAVQSRPGAGATFTVLLHAAEI